ncbi:MAG: hypothetical protein ABSH30_07275 [Acidimicrobiales bacterium]|jgi:hypothetical protein
MPKPLLPVTYLRAGSTGLRAGITGFVADSSQSAERRHYPRRQQPDAVRLTEHGW